jgi:hypothetical protein
MSSAAPVVVVAIKRFCSKVPYQVSVLFQYSYGFTKKTSESKD